MMLVVATQLLCAYTARSTAARTAAVPRRVRQATSAITMGLSKEDEMLTMGPGDMVDAVCRGLTDNDRGDDDEGFAGWDLGNLGIGGAQRRSDKRARIVKDYVASLM